MQRSLVLSLSSLSEFGYETGSKPDTHLGIKSWQQDHETVTGFPPHFSSVCDVRLDLSCNVLILELVLHPRLAFPAHFLGNVLRN